MSITSRIFSALLPSTSICKPLYDERIVNILQLGFQRQDAVLACDAAPGSDLVGQFLRVDLRRNEYPARHLDAGH